MKRGELEYGFLRCTLVVFIVGAMADSTTVHADDTARLNQPECQSPSTHVFGKNFFLVAAMTALNFATGASTGLLTIALPQIAIDIELSDTLLLW